MTGGRSGSRRSRVPLTPAQRALVERSTLVSRLALATARRASPLSYDDLVSAGNEELVRAAYRYDQTSGVPFDAYAYTAVHYAMRKAIGRARREARSPLIAHAHAAAYDFLDAERTASPLDESGHDARQALEEHAGALAATFALGLAASVSRLPEEDGVLARIAHERLLTELGQVLDGMPTARRLIELRYFEAREWEEVAAALGCSSATARREHASALRLLSARLRARGHGADDVRGG